MIEPFRRRQPCQKLNKGVAVSDLLSELTTVDNESVLGLTFKATF